MAPSVRTDHKATAKRSGKTHRAPARAAGAWRPGGSAATGVSGNGGYRDGAADEVLALATCCWRGLEITTLSGEPKPLFAPALPAAYATRHLRRSWTGRAIDYRWRGGGLTVELRTTLPGPMLRAHGRTLRLRWASGAEPGRSDGLGGAPGFDSHGLAAARGGRLWVARSPVGPVLIAASAPVRAIRVTTHMHWEVEFARAGGALLVVPLLRDADIPEDAAARAAWLELAARPPLEAEERFRERDGRIELECRFPGARLAPLPATFALLGTAGGLLEAPAGRTLLHGWSGPFAVAPGPSWTASIAMAWSRVRWEPQATAGGELGDIPEELAYAGDANWEPGTAMDQLLSLRTWAPLLRVAPAALQERLAALLAPPSAAALRAGVETIAEPASGLRWARLRQMWDHTGDAAYDIDWYNGLALSGLERATVCGVPAIESAARATASACRRERASLIAYFDVFHDWSLACAWSDPRGWMWNADCVHNGLEGILGEARLRDVEGNADGAAHLRWLAARTAVSLRAMHALPRYLGALAAVAPAKAFGLRLESMTTWSAPRLVGADATARAIGVQALTSWREVSFATPETRNPYPLAGNFPEWNALLAQHGDAVANARLGRDFDGQAERYRDWIAFYIGDDWQQRRARGDQEARVQASVFYNLAPEIAFRRFVLGEEPERLEARFATPLNLAEQLLLRGRFRAVGASPKAMRAQGAAS